MVLAAAAAAVVVVAGGGGGGGKGGGAVSWLPKALHEGKERTRSISMSSR